MSSFAHYGNPLKELEDEEAPKRFKDDTVRDEKGRRRFHGAFTGGFSAGYFNTVDTKEGWTPSQFVSSRSNRANKSDIRTPHDFMDNEDMGELGFAPQRLQVQDGARSSNKNENLQRNRTGVGSQRELLATPLKSILKDDTSSIGMQILRKMGWRDGKGIGPKVCLKANYGPRLPDNLGDVEVAPDDIEITEIKGTDKPWGLGYTPAERLDLFGERIDRERVTQTVANIKGRRLGIRGQAFGVGAFEEDDEDIYAKDDLTQYAYEEVDFRKGESRESLKAIEAKKPQLKNSLLEGFVAVEVDSRLNMTANSLLSVPTHWIPKYIGGAEPPKREMTREEKIAAIADRPYNGSVFDLLSDEAKARIEAVKRAAQERNQPSTVKEPTTSTEPVSVPQEIDDKPLAKINVEYLRPFAYNERKQDRFERFVHFAEQGHQGMLSSIQPEHFSAWEAALEEKEFKAALLLVRPKLGLSNRFESKLQEVDKAALPAGIATAKDLPAKDEVIEQPSKGPPIRPAKDFGAKTRQVFEWHPKSLLCKRFNVPDPFPGDDTFGIPSSSALPFVSEKVKKEEEAQPKFDETEQQSAIDSVSSETVSAANSRYQNLVVEEAPSPPPMDLFKAIFSDAEDDDDEVVEDNPPEASSTGPEKKNSGIFANLDLSALNKRPIPKPIQIIENKSEEVTLPPMGPKPPPIMVTEKVIETKRKSKHKKEKSKKTKKKSKKHKRSKSSSRSSESSSDSDDDEPGSSKRKAKRKKKLRSDSSDDNQPKKKKQKKHKRKRSKKSTDESSTDDEEELDRRLKEKLRHVTTAK